MPDKHTITDNIIKYKDEIHKRNCRNFVSFAKGGMIITAVILLFGIILNGYTEFVLEYGAFLAYMIGVFVLASYCEKHQSKHVVFIYYAAITPVYLGGIMMGTFLDPDQPAITVMILMCVLTLFIITRPLYSLLYMVSIALVFCVCCYYSKDNAQFMADLVDLIIYTCISIGVHYFMLKGHVESAVTYCQLQYESERDALTTLYNRGTGETKVRRAIERGVPGAFMILDIDYFKSINDTYGHQVGDEAICEMARILCEIFASENVVFRLGGDEFAVFAPKLLDSEQLEQYFEKLKQAAQNIHTSAPECRSIGTSMGCTIYLGGQVSFEQIYKSSDEALYDIKKNGKGRMAVKEVL